MPINVIHLGAARIAALIARGEVSAVEAVEQHIAQLQRVNPALNAMVIDLFASARAAAREADAKQQRGEALGPLHGVPVTIKECFDMPGLPSTFGLESRREHRADEEDIYVARLRAAGAIPIAKSNVPQLLFYYESDNPVYGRANNPHNLARTPGGSSGGEGALVAAGASPLGLGNDIGGSIRVPANFCGITGIKPTTGRCDDIGTVLPSGQRTVRSQVGPMAPFVADVALGLKVLNGTTPEGEPGKPLGDYSAIKVSDLRIAFYTDDGTFTPAPAAARAVREAADMLRAAGAQVSAWQPPDAPQALGVLYGILGGDGMGTMKRVFGKGRQTPQIKQLMLLTLLPRWGIRALRGLLGAFGQRSMATTLAPFGDYSALHFWDVTAAQAAYEKRFSEALRNAPGGPFDIILCPVCALPAFTHGASRDLLTAGAYAGLYNLLGYPAGSVPVTRVRADEESSRATSGDLIEKLARKVEQGSAGLPIGVQVVARPWREHEALAVMQVIETAARQRVDFKPV